jgi:hypothetical protein
VVSFEKTALKNLDLLLNTAKPVIDTGSPLINQPIRDVGRSLFGTTNFPAFEAARRVAVNEVAKVTSNPNLTGVLSDAARKEVEGFVPANATLNQLYSVVKVLRQDMTNRHVSMDQEIAAIQTRIRGSAAPPPPPASSLIKMRTPGGQVYSVDPSKQKEWEARGAKVVP